MENTKLSFSLFKDEEFDGNANNAVNYLNVPANKTRLVVSTPSQAALALALTLLGSGATPAPGTWNDLYPKCKVKSAPESSTILLKNQVRAQIEEQIHIIYRDIPHSALTVIDESTLIIHPSDGTRSRVPVPTDQPSIIIVERGTGFIVIKITDPKLPESQAKPKGVAYTEIDIAYQSSEDKYVAANKAVTDALANQNSPHPVDQVVFLKAHTFPQESDYHLSGNTGKFLYRISFTEDQIGGTVYIRARYLNTRNEAGPKSDVISTVIS